MGRTPKPDHLKLVCDPGKRGVPVRPKASVMPADTEPPEHLCDDAKAIWRDLLPTLSANRTIGSLDGNILAIHCDAVAGDRRETVAIAEEGTTVIGPHGPVVNPRTKVQATLRAIAMRTAAVLGIGQANRQRLTPIPEGMNESPEDEFFARTG